MNVPDHLTVVGTQGSVRVDAKHVAFSVGKRNQRRFPPGRLRVPRNGRRLAEKIKMDRINDLNRAVAVSKVDGAEAALAMIEPLAHALGGYFYFVGVRGALLQQLGRSDEARRAFECAIALAHSPAEAAHIRMQLDRLMNR